MSITLEQSSSCFLHTNQNTDQINPLTVQETDQLSPLYSNEQETDPLFEAFLEFIQTDDRLGVSTTSNSFEDKLNQITLTHSYTSNLHTIDHTYAKNIKHKESENEGACACKQPNDQETPLLKKRREITVNPLCRRSTRIKNLYNSPIPGRPLHK